jgi:protein TonB
MRNAVLGSTLVHLAVTIVLFAFRMPVKVIVPGPDVVQVALIEPASAPSPSVTPTPPAPEPEDQGVVIEPDKKKPPKKTAPVEPPRPAPPPRTETKPQPSARPATALASARVGSAGLRGDIGVDSNFEFAFYLQLVRDKIASNWSPPTGLVNSGAEVRSVVYFRISRHGEVSDIRLEKSSGNEYYDRAAVRAVTVSNQMPMLPNAFVGSWLGVHFGFDWEAP